MTQTLEGLLVGELPPGLYRGGTRVRATTITRRAQRHGWRVYWLDGRGMGGKAEFLGRAAGALRFPGYFGHNWDAFEECLNDMSWEPAQPTLVIFDHAGRFASAAPEQFATALEILLAATRNREEGTAPLVVLVRGAARAAGHLPVVQI